MRDGIYLVTDAVLCGPRGVVETVRLAVDGGVSTVQLRDKEAGLDDLLRQLEALAGVIDGRACLIVNDNVEAARQTRSRGIPVDGVHVGQDDAPVDVVRAQLGPNAVIGLSADQPEHFAAIPEGVVDYVGIGTIRATATKKDAPEALGVDKFGELARATALRTCAIGGITAGDVPALKRAGADAVAVVSAICAAADPEAAAREMVRLWEATSRNAQ